MQNISLPAHFHKKTCNADAATNSFYDDVFSGPTKFPLPPPSLSPRLQDYTEIFGAINSRSSTSIPVLDLPVSVGDEDFFFDARSSCFDYSEVFGGIEGSDFATSFEELVRMSGAGDDEAWSPEEGDYLSEESEGSLKSEGFSNRESCEYVIDGNDVKFNISYNKNGGRSGCEDVAQSLPEYSFLVEKASSLPKMDDDDDDDYVDMRLSDDGHFNIDLSREMVIERPLKKTVSNLVNGDRKSGMLFEDDVRTRRDYVRTGSFPGESFVTISDVNLKTRPSKVPPPLRPPPPALEVKKQDSDELIHNGKASAFERSAGDGFLPFFDVEVDANSSAAVSAAAIKDAMEKAQAKMKSAKELMDRKREGFQSRTKSGLKDHKKDREGNIGRSIDGLGSNDGIETEIAERQYVKRTNRLVQSSLEGENYPNGSKREENQSRKSLSSSSQGPVKIDEVSEWKEATEFFELVRTDKSKNIFDNVITESMSARSTNVIEHGRMEQKENDKKGKPACRELEEYERKACVSKEVSASQESNGRLEAAAVVVQRQKGLQRKAQSSKEASRQKENEKKLMKDMQLAETVRKHLITDDYEVYENMEMPYQEIKLEEMEAKQHKEKEPHSEEANKRSDEDKGFTHEKKGLESKKREAMGKLDNEKKLNAALEQANKERRLKEDIMEETEKEKRMEANEREENKKNKKEALEREENARRLREALEREENERRLDEALEREENERRRMEAYKREENEKSLREAHEREENEKRLSEAFEKQENERRQRETLEKEQKERRLREALEKEENLRRLKQKLDQEENERRLRQKLEKEENERRLREKLEKEENERRQRSAAEQEENEKRQRETFEREENERLKVALVKKEDNRERQACEKVENNLLKKACGKEEIQKVRRDDFGNIKTDSTGKIPEKIVRESNSLRGAQVGNGAEEGLKEIYNLEDFEDTSLEAHKPDSLEDAVDTVELRNAEDGLRSNQNGAAGANANIDGEKTPSELCQDDLEHENASEIPSEDGSLKSADEAGHNLPPMKFASHKSSALNQGKSYTNESNEKGSKNEKAQVSQHHQDRKDSFSSTRMVKEIFVSGKKVEATQPATSEMKGNTLRPAQQVNVNQAAERKTKNGGDTISVEDKEIERIKREKELEMERLRKMEEERDREREREKDRMAVDLATLEARERANSDARERAERAAIERALAEARQRAINEARERLEKACAEAREKSLSDKASVEARIRAERAAVERATAEARERAFEKAMAERAASEARERLERSVSDKFSTSSRKTWMRQSSLSSDVQDMQMQNSGSFNDSRYQYSSVYGGSYNMERSNGFDGESPQRCKARLERHRRTAERAAKALAEKNMRDLLAQREQAERNRIAETLDAEVRRWSSGKQGNLRALLSTLQYILGPDSGWHPIPLTEVITSAAVKKAYRKATLCVHPDKLQQRGASIHQKYICEKVFDLLKEAWNKFNSEER